MEAITVKTSRIVLVVAMVLFVASFFVTAVGGGIAPSILGYECASMTLFAPWGPDGLRSLREEPLLYIALLLSGWINPVFLITMVLLRKKSTTNAGGKLRIVLLLMLPVCWIVFSKEHARPGFGYFFWTAAMVLALYSTSFSGSLRDTKTPLRAASL
jgi:hypothetical protein